MTPEAARDSKLGVKMQTLRVIMCPGIPQISKRGGHEWPQKAAKNPKLGVIFAKCALMTPCPPPAQTLLENWHFALSLTVSACVQQCEINFVFISYVFFLINSSGTTQGGAWGIFQKNIFLSPVPPPKIMTNVLILDQIWWFQHENGKNILPPLIFSLPPPQKNTAGAANVGKMYFS